MNMKKEVVLPDRLGGEKQITFIPVNFVQKTKRLCPDEDEDNRSETERPYPTMHFSAPWIPVVWLKTQPDENNLINRTKLSMFFSILEVN